MDLSHNQFRSTQSKNGDDIAIIGMACMFPGASTLEEYWQNILQKVDAITDPPPEAWDANLFFDPDSTDNDRLYCKRGGFLGPYAEFNPLEFGVVPVGLEGGEPDQWLALKVTQQALEDAGYLERLKSNPEEGQKTAVILGKGTYLNRGNLNMVQHSLVVDQTLQIIQSLHPEYGEVDLAGIREALKEKLPPFNAETAHGLIPNIIAARVANRLDLMGPTFTVDAACASSLVAIEIAVGELLSGQCDLAVAGGAQVTTPIPIFTLFCQLNALSRRQEIHPFDQEADGTILGEGIGVVILKRRQDAERDGDRIYACIKGVGIASDGRALGVLAPRLEGEVLAMRRAYESAGISPDSIGLMEAHGTGTPVGDLTEIRALEKVLPRRDGQLPYCALGSVKSMIGHTMPAAGIAGVIKTALALHHKILPPSLNCETPHPALEKTNCYVNTETRPWIHGNQDVPRRAGVNAFGFGGINAHVILEEAPEPVGAQSFSHLRRWEDEVFILEADSREALIQEAQKLHVFLEPTDDGILPDLAYSLNKKLDQRPYRLSLVAHSSLDLRQKLERAQQRLQDPECRQIKDNRGIYFFEAPLYPEGKIAFLFPGEGSQYANMLADLSNVFPEVRKHFDRIDQNFVNHARNYLPSDFIFPRPLNGQYDHVREQLWHIDGAIEAVLTANQALFSLLSQLEIEPDVIAGHSTGEYSAMLVAGIIPLTGEDFVGEHLQALNKRYEQVAMKMNPPRAMLLAVGTDVQSASELIESINGEVYIGMENCPHQTVIIGEETAVEEAAERMRSRGLIYQTLPFDRPYHTPLFATYSEAFNSFFEQLPLSPPKTTVYSCITTAPYPQEVSEIRALILEQSVKPVRFRETIEVMHADGVRLFVEAGPKGSLASFVDDTLRGKPHLVIPANLQHRSGVSQLNHLVGLLGAQGVPLNLIPLYQRRRVTELTLDPMEDQASERRLGTGAMKLKTGWAGMGISPEAAARLRKKTSWEAKEKKKPRDQEDAKVDVSHLTPVSSPSNQTPDASLSIHTAANGAEDVHPLQAHFRLMKQFLDTQSATMQQYMSRRAARAAVPEDEHTLEAKGKPEDGDIARLKAGYREQFPFIRTILSLIPGQEMVALCELNLDEDLFLSDHTMGRNISNQDEGLLALPIVPLTISMEIMAEAASVLLPDLVFTGMKDVRAHRWILLEQGAVTLRVEAERQSASMDQEVRVRLRAADEPTGSNRTPIVEGTMIFAPTYPPRPELESFTLRNERPSRWQPDQLYTEGMFHGPAFQAVESIERWGENGLSATLRSLPIERFLRTTPNPAFIAEPVILDAAGQLVGFWTMEHLETGFVVFPYRLKALRFYDPPIRTPQKIRAHAEIQLTEGMRVITNFDILQPDGRLWIRLEGWEDKRFDLPERFYRFLLDPREEYLAELWTAPLRGVSTEQTLLCSRVVEFPSGFFGAHSRLWEKVFAYLVLSRIERSHWRGLKGPSKRRIEWLLGRLAAKDAVRFLLREAGRPVPSPADIEILTDDRGRPLVQGPWSDQRGPSIQITIAHTKGVAAAMAGFEGENPSYGVGIDIETVRRRSQDFEGIAFTPVEKDLLNAVDQSEDRWPLRLWCAKEAMSKALGTGMTRGPLGVAAEHIDVASGRILLRLAGEMASLFPELKSKITTAYTRRDGDFVVACVPEVGS